MLLYLETKKNTSALFNNMIHDKNKQIWSSILKLLNKAGLYNSSTLKPLHR